MPQQFLFWISNPRQKIVKWKDICTPFLTEGPSTRAMLWNQPMSPVKDEWIMKLRHIGILCKCKEWWNHAIHSNFDGCGRNHVMWCKEGRMWCKKEGQILDYFTYLCYIV